MYPRESEITERLALQLKNAIAGEWNVEIDKKLEYLLPDRMLMTHKNDILLTSKSSKDHISIEVKFRSSVTDAFKARSFDAFHLKKTHKDTLFAIMVYVKADNGITTKRAESICHWFDAFFEYEYEQTIESWDVQDLITVIKKFQTRT